MIDIPSPCPSNWLQKCPNNMHLRHPCIYTLLHLLAWDNMWTLKKWGWVKESQSYIRKLNLSITWHCLWLLLMIPDAISSSNLCMTMLWSGPQAKWGGPHGKERAGENRGDQEREATNSGWPYSNLLCREVRGQTWYCRPVISALWEAKSRGWQVQGQPQ